MRIFIGIKNFFELRLGPKKNGDISYRLLYII